LKKSIAKGGYEICAEVGHNQISFVVSEDQARNVRVEDVLEIGIRSGILKQTEIAMPVIRSKPNGT
jgi:hypothetical protein